MTEQTETMTISNRGDFAQWAIERAKAIVDALLEVFDGLLPQD